MVSASECMTEVQEVFSPVIMRVLTWDALRYEAPPVRRALQERAHGNQTKAYCRKAPEPSKGSTLKLGCLTVSRSRQTQKNEKPQEYLEVKAGLTAYWIVNEFNVLCKGNGFEMNILSSEIAKAKMYFNYKSKNWNNSMNTSIRVLSGPISLPGNML